MQNVIKDLQWYAAQGSDTTMMTMAPFARTINKIMLNDTTAWHRVFYFTKTTCSKVNRGRFLKRRIIFATVTTSFWQYTAMRCRSFSFQ